MNADVVFNVIAGLLIFLVASPWKKLFRQAKEGTDFPTGRNDILNVMLLRDEGWLISIPIYILYIGVPFLFFICFANYGYTTPDDFISNLTLAPSLYGLIFGCSFILAIAFLIYASDTLFFCFFAICVFNYVLLPAYNSFGPENIPSILSVPMRVLCFIVFFGTILPLGLFTMFGALKTLYLDKDRQAHLLFVASMAALGWGLCLQNGGHLANMAALNIPFVVPFLDWSIPWTESIGFPFALFGYVHDPAGSVVSGISQARSGEIIVLLVVAALLLLFAKARLKNAGTPLHPAFPLLTLALLLASICSDIALHWSGAPVLSPVLVLFNRAFACLAVGVLLFWWGNIPIGGETVPGAENDMGIARGKAAWRALKIFLWCVALVWVMTAASHLAGEWRHGIRLILAMLWMVPGRMAINFPNDYRDDLQQYHKAKQMWEQSYNPARIVPTKQEIDDALGD